MKTKSSEMTVFNMVTENVTKAAKKDSRKVLRYVYVDKDNLVATDGKLLVTMPKESCFPAPEPGFYDLAKIDGAVRLIPNKEVKDAFPNYRVISEAAGVATAPQKQFKTSKIESVTEEEVAKLQVNVLKNTTKHHFLSSRATELLLKSKVDWSYQIAPNGMVKFKFEELELYCMAMYSKDVEGLMTN